MYSGSRLEGKYTVLYNFCEEQGCADGQGPEAAVVLDQKGNLYGTTAGGRRGAQRRRSGIQANSRRQGDSPLQLLLAERLRRRNGTLRRAGLRPEWKHVWHDPKRRRKTMKRRASYSSSTPKGKETVLFSFSRERWGLSRYRSYLRPEGKPVWDDPQRRGKDGEKNGAGVVFKITP